MACTYIDKPTKLCRNGTSERVVVHEEIRLGRQRKVADFSWEGTGEIIVGKHELVRETSELDRKYRFGIGGQCSKDDIGLGLGLTLTLGRSGMK